VKTPNIDRLASEGMLFTNDALVELVDVAPTLMEAAGLDIYPAMQGKSLWGLLQGEECLGEHRADVYSEYYNACFRHRDPLAYVTMLFDGVHKLVRYHGLGDGELYDLEADPNETHNRWNDPKYREAKTELLSRLTDRMAWTCDPMPERKAWW
jgi:arylsulfatase